MLPNAALHDERARARGFCHLYWTCRRARAAKYSAVTRQDRYTRRSTLSFRLSSTRIGRLHEILLS